MDAAGYCLVSVVENIDPEEADKQRAVHVHNEQQLVQTTQQRYGL